MTSDGPRLRNLRLDIAYDGTDFFGWQRQPDRPTVQGHIEAAIERITRESPQLIGAGRTDAGVHAAGQVANFQTSSAIPCGNLQRAINDLLPQAIRVLRVREAPAGFHARYDAKAKLYRYRILNRELCPPFLARFVHHYEGRLDVAAMQRVAALLVGEHDFTSFAAADSSPGTAAERHERRDSAVRTLFVSRVIRSPRTELLVYEVRGSGFLRHMVRNIVGTLIESGRGSLGPADIPRIFKARDRAVAAPTAPASGLTLVRVDYERPQ